MGLSKPTIRILLEDLDRRIKNTKQSLAELQQAKSELESQLSKAEPNESKTVRHRLPRGMPRRFIERALRKHRKATMGELRRSILEDSQHELKDASARRALDEMISEGLVQQNEDGSYELLRGGAPVVEAK